MRDLHAELFAALAAPFANHEVKTRRQNNRDLAYITARVVMNRLDQVVGPSSWWDEYTPIENAVICRLSILLPDGQTISKCDVGGFSATNDSSDVEKSGFSDAFKRAAVKFGIGRYLYGDGVPDFGQTTPIKESKPSPRPDAAAAAAPAPARREFEPTLRSGRKRPDGRAYYGICKDNGTLDKADRVGRALGLPARMVEWTPDQVAQVQYEFISRPQPILGEPQTIYG